MILKMMSELKTLKHLDLISKPTNARKCMKVYYTHTVYLLHVSATHVAIFREVQCKGQIHQNIAEVFLTITHI